MEIELGLWVCMTGPMLKVPYGNDFYQITKRKCIRRGVFEHPIDAIHSNAQPVIPIGLKSFIAQAAYNVIIKVTGSFGSGLAKNGELLTAHGQ